MSVFGAGRVRLFGIAVVAGAVVAVGACDQQTPVALDDGALPGEPVSIEIVIPWDEFASNLEVFGGYGSAEEIGLGILAEDFAGTLDARTLIRWGPYPTVATVTDTTGAARPDSTLTILGARFVAVFDTIASTNTGPVTVQLGATTEVWDAATVSWDNAVDTINDQRPWTEPGAGPVVDYGQATWDPATGDSVVFVLDSAQAAAWNDTTDLAVGARLDVIDPGVRLTMNSALLRLQARPSSNPDTIIEVTAGARTETFVYSPFPQPPPDGVRIGGAPSWRTILDIAIPATLTGPPELCAAVGCPHELTPGEISYAALLLTSRTTEAAFQPTDSIRLDVRPVLDRSSMPKSPLGASLVAGNVGRTVGASAFGAGAGLEIEVPFTTFARDVLRGIDGDGNPSPGTLALLSVIEPSSISFASFEGPGAAGEPALKLILTIGPPVELP